MRDFITRMGIKKNNKGKVVNVYHNAGFFSCCSVKLRIIVDFINENKALPYKVTSHELFNWYKKDIDKDITFDYFEDYNIIDVNILQDIDYHSSYQFKNYSDLDYEKIKPLIKKYFSPSVEINEIVNNIEEKYNLVYENICVLFYRGNDKNTEIEKCGYDEYLEYANQILKNNSKILFLIQSDETEFIEFMTNKFPDNSFYFKDEIRHIKKSTNDTVDKYFDCKISNYEFSKKFLAITIIMSKCKYIICGSGNCDIWIMFYRGNNKNVIQNLHEDWYNSVF